MRYAQLLETVGYTVNHADFYMLSEANQIEVTDSALTHMMKFITDKYNSLDFKEIEKSAGDIEKFKYKQMLFENLDTLQNVYNSSTDPGATKYIEVIKSCRICLDHLINNRDKYSRLYKSGNGIVQLMYTSLLSGVIYCIGTLISNTIRFVTIEQDTECEVLFDEIPGSIRHVHIKNVVAAANDIKTFEQVIDHYNSPKNMNEAIGSAAVIAGLSIIGVIILLPRLIVLIREIIYSIYYTRVKVAEMLDIQEDLIRTNIESLEQGRGSKKVIARQRKIANKLNDIKDRIAIKIDTAEVLKKNQIKKENSQLTIDKNSEFVTAVKYAESDIDSVLI